ncbi:hypothetical protein DNTS_002496 [Danionella cerebrum]|uniref:Uncharacterized protein n=1 Tax=Danionella cerebrum TaxID=2873325 RepID=A0A553RAK8_9TELE|nr:hypothetical protein DNTS_002496 [Danionella translucida]TRY99220.1 hypothetical protein DNTS_002496 [Danionella translucida]
MLKGGYCLEDSRRALHTGRKTAVPTASSPPHEGSPKQTPFNVVMGLQRKLSNSTVNRKATLTQSKTCYLSPPSAQPVADILLLSLLIAPVGFIRAAVAVCSVPELSARATLCRRFLPPPPHLSAFALLAFPKDLSEIQLSSPGRTVSGDLPGHRAEQNGCPSLTNVLQEPAFFAQEFRMAEIHLIAASINQNCGVWLAAGSRKDYEGGCRLHCRAL